MRARGVFYRNRDSITYGKQEKKVGYAKTALKYHVTKYFIFTYHVHIITFFFLSIQTEAHFHFHPYTLGRLNCINAIDYLKADHIQQLSPPLGARVHLCTQVLHKGTHS